MKINKVHKERILMNMIGYALTMAKKFYDKDTYAHAMRVATYIAENPIIDDENMEDCIALGIMHDLLEDTEYSSDGITDSHFKNCLELLTKPNDMDYINYIKNIKECSETNPEAYWVKLADMKDHLVEEDTLTDRLKEKYFKALPYLL